MNQHAWWRAVSLICAMMLTGCGDEGRGIPKANVSGLVTVQGEPLTSGVVNLYSAETGIAAGIPLTPEGTFTIPDGIEVGTYQVTVTPPAVGGDGLGPAPATPSEPSKIPEKYRSQATTDLQIEVKTGDNKTTIDLK